MANVTGIENLLSEGFGSVFGLPEVAGIVFLAFFTMLVFMMNLRVDAKMAVMVPALLLAVMFIPWLSVLLALALGFIICQALMRLLSW